MQLSGVKTRLIYQISAQSLIVSLIATALAALFLNGCTAGTNGQRGSRASAKIVGIETVSQQALNEVLATPTQFTVPAPEAADAWARARLFFMQYLGVSNISEAESVLSPKQSLLSNEGRKDSRFAYQVMRETLKSGETRFLVTCLPSAAGTSAQNAERNARNLARFIREGTLELSFLDQ
ncbi:MAG: hypothetical protein J5J00_01625 [Deltaproteobacteria bacterium]|nr:hypothetical protein [Deltaproteobacteria bacterium]